MTLFEDWLEEAEDEEIECSCDYNFQAFDADTDLSETLVLCPECGNIVINLN